MPPCISALLVLCGLPLACATSAETHVKLNLNPGWRFQLGEPPGAPYAADHDDTKWDIVSLPHSHQIFSAGLAGFAERGRNAGWYRRELRAPADWLHRKLFLEFQGAMQTTALWVNGKKAGAYAVSGYDSFHFDLTPYIKQGRNVIAVRVDNHPNRDIPPDGQMMDYILFGGLYRDVFLHVTDAVHLTFPWEATHAGIRLTLPQVSEKEAVVQAESTVRNESPKARKCALVTEIRDREGKVVTVMRSEQDIPAGSEFTFTQNSAPIPNPHLWSPDDPYLYRVRTIVLETATPAGSHVPIRLGDGSGVSAELDHQQSSLGIRWVKFDKEKGFFLNGRHLKLIGANYHQTWPFIGNAVPNGLSRRDAEQVKAMGVNWVRLSHYPHDPDFLDALDELGLMALAEAPSWVLGGSRKWMDNFEASFRSMIRRDRNHPSIIIWNACINHHQADPRLVRAAIEEDPTRERGQDTVPTPMNFTPRQISGGGALSVEHTGHTFPAQRGARATKTRARGSGGNPDGVEISVNREYEHAQRHWEQINAAYQKPDNSGLAVWCMYDYNTFRNTAEDRIAWKGACDLFRIPKYTFFWHQSELTTAPMAYVVRIDDTNAAVFSNCEQVRLLQDTGTGYQSDSAKGLPSQTHRPDTTFTTRDRQTISYALNHPPFHFTVASNAVALKAEGLIAGATKATCEWKQFGSPVALIIEADRATITADGADLSRIIVTAVDTSGTAVDNCELPITFTIEGLGQLIGENPVKLRAGKIIILAQSAFVPGEITITAASKGLRTANVVVSTQPVSPGVDMPQDLPAKQPTQRVIAHARHMPQP